MHPYRRPPVEIATWTDPAGTPIAYGERWGDDGPPDDTYSQCRHPERYEPVETVGRSLVDFLTEAYAVERTDSATARGTRVVFRPRSGEGTSMQIDLPGGNLPGATVTAGWRFANSWPSCGCDACDDDVLDLIEDLEDTVLSIAEGAMSEWRTGPDPSKTLAEDDEGRPIGTSHVTWEKHVRFDGRLQTESATWSAYDPEPVELPTAPHRWPAWPLRD